MARVGNRIHHKVDGFSSASRPDAIEMRLTEFFSDAPNRRSTVLSLNASRACNH